MKDNYDITLAFKKIKKKILDWYFVNKEIFHGEKTNQNFIRFGFRNYASANNSYNCNSFL